MLCSLLTKIKYEELKTVKGEYRRENIDAYRRCMRFGLIQLAQKKYFDDLK